MAIRFQCPECHETLTAPDEWQGRRAKCKKCAKPIAIPQQTNAVAAPAPAKPIETVPAVVVREATAKVREPAPNLVAAELVPAQLANPTSKPASAPTTAPETATAASRAAPKPVAQKPAARGSARVRTLTPQELETAFEGSIKRVPLPIGYRLSLVAVAVVMLILPLVYVGLICLVGYGGVMWAMNAPQLLADAPNKRNTIVLIAAPIIVAIIAVIFMIKPLFARSAKASSPKSVTRDEQPVLFDFVERVCLAVGAPIPKRIDIDTEVNASASFRRGWLSLFQPNDLVLTIGMPLVQGLTARELGGVLAHEFGHFSQGMGMRLSYVIRSISFWFARVVYERDRADELLVSWATGSDFRIGIVLHIARFMVWLTRRVLWVLMMIGNAVSGLLLRQMEYDADRYEIQLAGTESFAMTFAKLQRLGLAYQQSLEEAQHFFIDGKLVDDLPGLIAVNHHAQSKELIEMLAQATEHEKSSWYDTHPVTRDRIAAARKMNAVGLLQLDQPAEALFIKPQELSKSLTRHFFEAAFGAEFKPSMLASVQELTRFKQAAREAEEARERMFGSKFSNPRAMHLAAAQDRQLPEHDALQQMQKARAKLKAGLAAYEATSQSYDEADTRWVQCHRAATMLACGAKLKPAEWEGLPVDSLQSVEFATADTLSQLARLHEQLLAFEKAFEACVDGALQWLFTRCRQDQSPELVGVLQQSVAALRCLAMQDRSHRMMLDLRNEFSSMIALFSTVGQGQQLTKAQQAQFELHGNCVRQYVAQLAAQFASIPYPFEHAEGKISMAHYLAPQADQVTDTTSACEAAHGMLQNYQLVFFRSIGTLAALIEKVEALAAAT